MPITEFNLNGCDRIRDEGLGHLAELPLRKLTMIGCFRLTHEGRASWLGLPQFRQTQLEF